jgi:hypothetical protein
MSMILDHFNGLVNLGIIGLKIAMLDVFKLIFHMGINI